MLNDNTFYKHIKQNFKTTTVKHPGSANFVQAPTINISQCAQFDQTSADVYINPVYSESGVGTPPAFYSTPQEEF